MSGEAPKVTRRGFLSTLTWAIGGLISAGLGIPAIAYIIGPAVQNDTLQQWIKLGSPSKVELGQPTLFRTNIERKSGWIVSQEELTVYVRTDNGRDFVALSNICSHLGCRVRWVADRQQFFCPCHNGVFDKDGNVVSGPPPHPLDRFEARVEDGQLEILGG
jgi:Rieske Fe-S protein